MKVPKRRSHDLTLQDVRDIVGDLDDAKIAALLAVDATPADLEEAAAFAAGESDVMGDLERPLDGVVARLYEILTADQAFLEPD